MNVQNALLTATLALGLLACNAPPSTITPPPASPTPANPVPPDPGQSAISEIAPQSQLLAVGATSVRFAVKTREPAVVRADSSDKAFQDLALTSVSSDGLTHTFTASVQTGQPYTFFVKAAPKAKPDQPYDLSRSVHYRVATPYNPPFPRLFTLW